MIREVEDDNRKFLLEKNAFNIGFFEFMRDVACLAQFPKDFIKLKNVDEYKDDWLKYAYNWQAIKKTPPADSLMRSMVYLVLEVLPRSRCTAMSWDFLSPTLDLINLFPLEAVGVSQVYVLSRAWR
jgi:hypothetical protein